MGIKVFDLETTGLSLQYDRILQLCLLDMGDGNIDSWKMKNFYFKAETPISQKSFELHKLSKEFLEEASGGLTFAEQSKAVRAEFNSTISLSGHNILAFDIPLLNNCLARVGEPLITYNNVYDTISMRKLMKGLSSPTRPSKLVLYLDIMKSRYGYSVDVAKQMCFIVMGKLGIPKSEWYEHNAAYDVVMSALTLKYCGLIEDTMYK